MINNPVIISIHIVSAILGILSGTILFFTKRTQYTQYIGYIWRVSMLSTAISGFFIAQNGISWLHGFSLITIISICSSIYFASKGNWYGHNKAMLGAYIGIIIAFIFTLYPTRRLGIWMFENLHISSHESQLYGFYFFLFIGLSYSLIPLYKFYKIKK